MNSKRYIFTIIILLYTITSQAANILLVIDNEWEFIRRVNYIVQKSSSYQNDLNTDEAVKLKMQTVFYTTLQASLIAQGHTVTVITTADLQKQTTGERIMALASFTPMPKYKSKWDKITSIKPKYSSLNINVPELQPYLNAQLIKYDYIISLNRINFSHNAGKAFFNRGKRQINMHYDIIDKNKNRVVGKRLQMHLNLKKSALPAALTTLMNAPAKQLVLAFQPFIEKK